MTTSPLSALARPATDPTAIFEQFRNGYATELLAVAVVDFDVFGRLARGPKSHDELRDEIGLADRAANVLFTALRAMKVMKFPSGDHVTVSAKTQARSGGVKFRKNLPSAEYRSR